LYVSTVSSSLATLYGTPRVLQSIAAENVIPIMAPLADGVSCGDTRDDVIGGQVYS
jgi:hypothetical protein